MSYVSVLVFIVKTQLVQFLVFYCTSSDMTYFTHLFGHLQVFTINTNTETYDLISQRKMVYTNVTIVRHVFFSELSYELIMQLHDTIICILGLYEGLDVFNRNIISNITLILKNGLIQSPH
jgi:hypothetical protein